jgi:hypothetical protein
MMNTSPPGCKLGFTSYQKCSAAIRMLAYEVASDLIDEYLQISESICLESMYRFYKAVIAVFCSVLESPQLRTLLGCCQSMRKEGFQR